MIDDNINSNSTVFFPYFLKSHSSEGPLYISRENSFFDTKISSKEFQLQYNKSFNNFNQCIDNKLSQMINKTNYTNILMKVETLLSQMETIDNDENYMRLSDSFFELTSVTSNPPNEREDYLRALNLQNMVLEKMIQYVQKKVD